MPADVNIRPSSTTCLSYSTITDGNDSRIQSSERQWVVAWSPSSKPANPRSIEPVQTDVRVSTSETRLRNHSSITGFLSFLRVPQPPGTTRISNFGQLSNVWSGITFMPPVVSTGSFFSATNSTSNGDGSFRLPSSLKRVAQKTSKGPQKSRTSMFSNNTIPARFLSITSLFFCRA